MQNYVANLSQDELLRKIAVLEEEKAALESQLLDLHKKDHSVELIGSSTPDDTMPYASLCMVYFDDNGNPRLDRLTDVGEKFIFSELDASYPYQKRLYAKIFQGKEGFLGIWNWNSVPNRNDSSKSYIITEYNVDCTPVEVVIIPDCSSAGEIILALKSGLEQQLLSERILFVCRENEQNRYTGILCTAKKLMTTGNRLCLRDDVISVPVYQFGEAQILSFKGRKVLRILDLGLPKELLPVKDPIEVVRKHLLSRMTWNLMKQKDFSKNSYQKVHDLISELTDKTFYQELSGALDYSEDQVKKLVSQFIAQADSTFSIDQIELDIFSQAVQHSPALMSQCKSVLTREWEEENALKIHHGEKILETQANQFEKVKSELKTAKGEIAALQAQSTQLQSTIASQQQLAIDVETQVKARIQQAQTDVASFISEQVFARAVHGVANHSMQEKNPIQAGIPLPEEDVDNCEKWEDLLPILRDELEMAGVGPSYTACLSAYLYAAYECKTPILLIGPRGRAIAETLSRCVSGKTCTILHCNQSYSSSFAAQLDAEDPEVVLVDNLFAPGWTHGLNDYIQDSQHFFVATHPYAEDLLIESRELLNYWIPVFTEPFVTGKAQESSIGAKKAEKYTSIKKVFVPRTYAPILRSMNIGPLAALTIRQLLAYMHAVEEKCTTDHDVLVALLPCAYLSGRISALNKYLEEHPVDKVTEMLLHPYCGDSK